MSRQVHVQVAVKNIVFIQLFGLYILRFELLKIILSSIFQGWI